MNATLKKLSNQSAPSKEIPFQQDLGNNNSHDGLLFVEAKNGVQTNNFILQPEVLLSDDSGTVLNSVDVLNVASPWIPQNPIILVAEIMSEEFRLKLTGRETSNFILNSKDDAGDAGIKAVLIQRKAEKELVDYQYALDQATIVAITDQKGVILYVNDNFCKISKFNKSELIGSDYGKFNSRNHPSSYIKNL